MNRSQIADQILARLEVCKDDLRLEFNRGDRIRSFVVDDLLSVELAQEIYSAFPSSEKMILRNNIRERKYVAAQMNLYALLLEEAVYAFQDVRVAALISEITGFKNLLPDDRLYAGGISMMGAGHFLNPHLDNSHDHERKNYRVINLLYYVSPEWKTENGGNLELWPNGPRKPCEMIESRFNRLVVMETSRSSWHSVSPVRVTNQARCCVSNYYFSPHSPITEEYFHVTSFRGRPEERGKDMVLRADAFLRSAVRKIFKRGLVKPWHIYKK